MEHSPAFFISSTPVAKGLANRLAADLRQHGHTVVVQSASEHPQLMDSQRLGIAWAIARGYQPILLLDGAAKRRYIQDGKVLESLDVSDVFPVKDSPNTTIVDLDRQVFFDDIGLDNAHVIAMPTERSRSLGMPSVDIQVARWARKLSNRMRPSILILEDIHNEGITDPGKQEGPLSRLRGAFPAERQVLGIIPIPPARLELGRLVKTATAEDVVEFAVTGDVHRFPKPIVANPAFGRALAPLADQLVPSLVLRALDAATTYADEAISLGYRQIKGMRPRDVQRMAHTFSQELFSLGSVVLVAELDSKTPISSQRLQAAGAIRLYEEVVRCVTTVDPSGPSNIADQSWQLVAAGLHRRALFPTLLGVVQRFDGELAGAVGSHMDSLEHALVEDSDSSRLRESHPRSERTGPTTARQTFALAREAERAYSGEPLPKFRPSEQPIPAQGAPNNPFDTSLWLKPISRDELKSPIDTTGISGDGLPDKYPTDIGGAARARESEASQFLA